LHLHCEGVFVDPPHQIPLRVIFLDCTRTFERLWIRFAVTIASPKHFVAGPHNTVVVEEAALGAMSQPNLAWLGPTGRTPGSRHETGVMKPSVSRSASEGQTSARGHLGAGGGQVSLVGMWSELGRRVLQQSHWHVVLSTGSSPTSLLFKSFLDKRNSMAN
jgi:hypothetical protein